MAAPTIPALPLVTFTFFRPVATNDREAVVLAGDLKKVIQENREKSSCFTNGATISEQDQRIGKYGTASITQTQGTDSMLCGVKYTFNNTNVSDRLLGKVIDFDINDLGIIVKENTTTVDNQYLPTSVK